ncbi:MAG: hypothetical protein OCC49_02765 [Fibrobacterales bacterium]
MILLFLILPAPALSENDNTGIGMVYPTTIRITTHEYSPHHSQDLPFGGVALRIIKAAFATVNISVEIGFFPKNRSDYLASSGRWDATLPFTHTSEDEESYLISDTIYQSAIVLFSRNRPITQWSSFKNFRSLQLGATHGRHYSRDFQSAIDAGLLHVDFSISDKHNFTKLSQGDIDLFPCDIDAGYSIIQHFFEALPQPSFTHSPKIVTVHPHFLLISAESPHADYFLRAFNTGLKRLALVGRLDSYLKELRSTPLLLQNQK